MKINKPEDINKYCTSFNERYYRQALVETILQTNSKRVLEIGTNWGELTNIISQVVDLIVTVDIKKYEQSNFTSNKIVSLIVHPHTKRVYDYHDVQSIKYDFTVDSVRENFAIIKPYLPFDLVFIDGDHTEESFLKDWSITKLINPKYIVIDDFENKDHEVNQAYLKIHNINNYEEYSYEDWNILVDMMFLRRINND